MWNGFPKFKKKKRTAKKKNPFHISKIKKNKNKILQNLQSEQHLTWQFGIDFFPNAIQNFVKNIYLKKKLKSTKFLLMAALDYKTFKKYGFPFKNLNGSNFTTTKRRHRSTW